MKVNQARPFPSSTWPLTATATATETSSSLLLLGFFKGFVIYFKFFRGIICNEKRAEKCSISKKYARDNYNDCKT